MHDPADQPGKTEAVVFLRGLEEPAFITFEYLDSPCPRQVPPGFRGVGFCTADEGWENMTDLINADALIRVHFRRPGEETL